MAWRCRCSLPPPMRCCLLQYLSMPPSGLLWAHFTILAYLKIQCSRPQNPVARKAGHWHLSLSRCVR